MHKNRVQIAEDTTECPDCRQIHICLASPVGFPSAPRGPYRITCPFRSRIAQVGRSILPATRTGTAKEGLVETA
jgi:hypothetical protein